MTGPGPVIGDDADLATAPRPSPATAADGPDRLPMQWIDDELRGARRATRRQWLTRAAGLVAVLAVVLTVWFAGFPSVAMLLAGGVGLILVLLAGITVLRIVLSGPYPIVAVARAIVEEALGTRLAVVILMLVVVGLPSLPLVLDSDERLAYRMQFFLNWSLSSTFAMLAILSMAISCGSICGDIDSNRIHTSLSKPLRRWEYLVGKWLGVAAINALILVCAGVGIFGMTQILRSQPAADSADRRAVEEQVLTARAAALPVHPRREEFDRAVARHIEQVRNDDPRTFDLDPEGATRRLRSQQIYSWHTVNSETVASFLFTGLADAKTRTQTIQLRVEPFAPNSNTTEAEVEFAMWLNERPFPVKQGEHEHYILAVDQIHTLEIPTIAINEEGNLLVTIANRNRLMPGDRAPTTISFNPGRGMELLYRVDSFGANFARSLVIIFMKLVMLTAVAITASAWLGFPVAMLSCMIIFFAAIASSFITDAIDIYTGLDGENPTFVSMVRMRAGVVAELIGKLAWWDALKTIGSFFADGLLAIIPSFAEYDSITQVATGRDVPASSVILATLVLGLAYPLVLGVAGWLLIENRDLVRSSTA